MSKFSVKTWIISDCSKGRKIIRLFAIINLLAHSANSTWIRLVQILQYQSPKLSLPIAEATCLMTDCCAVLLDFLATIGWEKNKFWELQINLNFLPKRERRNSSLAEKIQLQEQAWCGWEPRPSATFHVEIPTERFPETRNIRTDSVNFDAVKPYVYSTRGMIYKK